MTALTAPTLAPATVEERDDGLRVVVKWNPQEGLDRLDAYAWGLPRNRTDLAERLVKAVNAGAVIQPDSPYTDVDGHMGWHTRCTILARMMNADLRRLGF